MISVEPTPGPAGIGLVVVKNLYLTHHIPGDKLPNLMRIPT